MPFKNTLYFVLPVLILTAISVIYYQFNPAKYDVFPKCPFHTLTGLNCPGCGSQRAIYSLLHGDFKKAISYNLLLVIGIPFVLICFYYKMRSLILRKDLRWNLVHYPLALKIFFVVVILFWVIRNIPIYPFTCLSAER
jgi:hypothetical protein